MCNRYEICGRGAVVVLLYLLASTGCTQGNEVIAGADQRLSEAIDGDLWNAGIVIPGETVSVAFPLVDTGVTEVADIADVKTSCDCVSAVPCSYLDPRGKGGVAIQLEFDGAKEEEHRTERGMTLRVKVKIHLKSGPILERDVAVLMSGKSQDASS